jgi:hypothetical protein
MDSASERNSCKMASSFVHMMRPVACLRRDERRGKEAHLNLSKSTTRSLVRLERGRKIEARPSFFFRNAVDRKAEAVDGGCGLASSG